MHKCVNLLKNVTKCTDVTIGSNDRHSGSIDNYRQSDFYDVSPLTDFTKFVVRRFYTERMVGHKNSEVYTQNKYLFKS